MLTFDDKPIAELTAVERSEIVALVQPYYINATSLLERELVTCNHIYLSRLSNRIAAFFMIGWEHLMIDGEPKEAVYYGLSCVDRNYRQTRISATVYIQAILGVVKRQGLKPIIGWGTTATPIVIRVCRRYWRVIQPDESDTFGTACYPIAEAIRQQHYSDSEATAIPFVLKAVAIDTNYVESERTMLATVKQRHSITIFDTLGIDETNGDRLLFLLDLPEADRLAQFRKELAQILSEFNG